MRESRVYTAGTFDILNLGHINLLERSKMYGDYLIVGVSTDELVYSYKHILPIIPYEERKQIVQALRAVDMVVKQEEILSIKQIQLINPFIITIGSDWKNKKIEGLEWAKEHGIGVIYLPYTMQTSSSIIKNRIIKNSTAIKKAQAKRHDK